MTEEACSHLNAITAVKHPTHRKCEECVKIGASWVHLRTCQTCGVTLCCDDSPNRHTTKHAHASGHPVIASAEPGERWLYCYPDDALGHHHVPGAKLRRRVPRLKSPFAIAETSLVVAHRAW